MILSFNILQERRSNLNFYQESIVELILPLFKKIDTQFLSANSFIEIAENRISISLIHVEDVDTIITLNIFRDHVTIWYAECNYSFYENPTDDKLKTVIKYLLEGRYITYDFFLKSKKLYSNTTMEDNILPPCILPFSLFHKFYIKFMKERIHAKKTTYKGFLIND